MLARIKAVKAGLILGGGLVTLLYGTSEALALELGEVTLSSSLNEPLDASIELLDIADLNAAQVFITLGTEQEFARANLERSVFLSNVQFEVELEGAAGQIHLSSTANVVDPLLSLIISARWPNGLVQKEYALLVALPTSSDAPVSGPAPTVGNTANTAVAPAPGGSASTYTVSPGDSLWQIAAANRPDNSVSVQQTMLAIQRANADAFVNNNINRVVSGRVLRIPTLQEVRTVDQTAAITQVGLQNSQLGVQPLVGNGASGAGRGQLQDELSVLSGDQEISAGGNGNSDLATTIAALENELMLSEESRDRARLENTELNGRLRSLDEEIRLLQNIIAVEEETVAQLQTELAAQSAATAQAQGADALAAQNNASAGGQGLLGKLKGILQSSFFLFGALIALVLAVLAFLLMMKKRRDDSEAQNYDFDPAAERLQDFDAAVPGSADLRDEKIYAEYEDHKKAVAAEPAYAGSVMAFPGNGRKADSDKLLDEVAIGDELTSLNGSGRSGNGAVDTFEITFRDLPEERADTDAYDRDASLEGVTFDNTKLPGTDDDSSGSDAFTELGGRSFDDSMFLDPEDEEGPYQPGGSGDECDTKLDLATAYQAMGEVEDAIDILNEVIAEGSPAQVEMAERLKQSWQSA